MRARGIITSRQRNKYCEFVVVSLESYFGFVENKRLLIILTPRAFNSSRFKLRELKHISYSEKV